MAQRRMDGYCCQVQYPWWLFVVACSYCFANLALLERCDPERFAVENSRQRAPLAYVPFGGEAATTSV